MICSTQNAMVLLFNAAKPNLTDEQLDFLGNLTHQAELEAGNIAQTLHALASSDVEEMLTGEEFKQVLFGLYGQAGTIAALVQIGTEARLIAAERKNSGQ